MIVKSYTLADRMVWDEFIAKSKNATFLFYRAYMDYHANRFQDHSLLIYDDKDHLLAVMPAHVEDKKLISHGGLTYGGVISDATMTTPLMLEIFDALLAYARAHNVATILYKTIPSIYCRIPAEEDRYALFRCDARLVRRDVLSVVDQSQRLEYQERRARKIKQARNAQLKVSESRDFTVFWPVLEKNLLQRFGVRPVHSLQEITLLSQRFPDNIRLHLCGDDQDILAGVVVYVTPQVVHVQYISASEDGKFFGALDLIFAELMEVVYAHHGYFDFGISTEQNGRHLNVGLIEQKEGFGARAIVHDHYEVSVI